MTGTPQVQSIRRLWRNGESVASIARKTHAGGADGAQVPGEGGSVGRAVGEEAARVGGRTRICPRSQQWLAGDRANWRKQRHTATRIWERSGDEHGAEVSLSTVTRAVARPGREFAAERDEAFMDLVWHPGEAQADFGEVDVLLRGVVQRMHHFVPGFPYSNMRYVAALPGETSGCVCHGLGEVFARVGMAPRVVVSGQRHGSGAPQPGRHGHADRDVPAAVRAVRVRGEVLQPVLGQREGQRGERGRVRAPQPGGAGPVGGGVPGVGDARGSTRANGSRRPTITGSACPSLACSNRRRSICSRCRPPRSTRSSGVR